MRYFAIIFTIIFLFSCAKKEENIPTQADTGSIEGVHTGASVQIPLNEKSGQAEKEFQQDLNILLNSVEANTHE